MIEMLTQNPDAVKHRLVQSMPLSMVDPSSTKPNKHFPLIFLTILEVDVHLVAIESSVYNGYNMYRLDPCSSCYNHNDVQCRVPV